MITNKQEYNDSFSFDYSMKYKVNRIIGKAFIIYDKNLFYPTWEVFLWPVICSWTFVSFASVFVAIMKTVKTPPTFVFDHVEWIWWVRCEKFIGRNTDGIQESWWHHWYDQGISDFVPVVAEVKAVDAPTFVVDVAETDLQLTADSFGFHHDKYFQYVIDATNLMV